MEMIHVVKFEMAEYALEMARSWNDKKGMHEMRE